MWEELLAGDDDGKLLLKTILKLEAEKEVVLEVDVAREFCKTKGLNIQNLRSPTQHGSYRNVRDRLIESGFLKRERRNNHFLLKVTLEGIKALKYCEEEVFIPQTPVGKRMYIDQVIPTLEPAADRTFRHFELQPTVTLHETPRNITVTVSCMREHTGPVDYLDFKNRHVEVEAISGTVTDFVIHSESDYKYWEDFSADFSEDITKNMVNILVDKAKKYRLPPSTGEIKLVSRINFEIRKKENEK